MKLFTAGIFYWKCLHHYWTHLHFNAIAKDNSNDTRQMRILLSPIQTQF